jgi:hypothetical protein
MVLAGSRMSGQAATGGSVQPISAVEATRVDGAVRHLMSTIAHDVTHDGPAAWSKHFEKSPAFFMVDDGQMAFPDSAAATKGIQDFADTIKSIRLEWANDLRVDPLTANFAVVAASYFEEQEPVSGKLIQERGYFTGIAELKDGRWQIRDAHWSSLRGKLSS